MASSVSLRNTRSMEKYFLGVKVPVRVYSCPSAYSILADTAVVCVRSRFFMASSRFHSYP